MILTIIQICAVPECKGPLTNYKNGRFCAEHIAEWSNRCGIVACGQPIAFRNALTCNNPAHEAWYNKWSSRFVRLSFPGVQRVIRQQRQAQGQEVFGGGPGDANVPALRVQLPALGEITGDKVVHTFRARSIYCLETIQWACGTPIGWGKCYQSESAPQVLAILNRLWGAHEDLRPGFITYDDACGLLRHIATQDINSPWIKSTKFIVDAWHYIGHKATDILCRKWCNPAPTNGAQPDLVVVQEDRNGTKHQTRAFNTETAEQFNAWLNSAEAQLRQMSDVTYDFVVHVLFMLYKEQVEKRIEKKKRYLPDDFWPDEHDDDNGGGNGSDGEGEGDGDGDGNGGN